MDEDQARAWEERLFALGMFVGADLARSKGEGREPLLVDAPEAARMLGISENALRIRCQRAQVPGIVRTGRRVQFRVDRLRKGR